MRRPPNWTSAAIPLTSTARAPYPTTYHLLTRVARKAPLIKHGFILSRDGNEAVSGAQNEILGRKTMNYFKKFNPTWTSEPRKPEPPEEDALVSAAELAADDSW